MPTASTPLFVACTLRSMRDLLPIVRPALLTYASVLVAGLALQVLALLGAVPGEHVFLVATMFLINLLTGSAYCFLAYRMAKVAEGMWGVLMHTAVPATAAIAFIEFVAGCGMMHLAMAGNTYLSMAWLLAATGINMAGASLFAVLVWLKVEREVQEFLVHHANAYRASYPDVFE